MSAAEKDRFISNETSSAAPGFSDLSFLPVSIRHTVRVRRVAVAVLAILGVLLVVIWAFQRRLIYLPSRGPVPRADAVTGGGREVTLTTHDGLSLGAWFVPTHEPDNQMTVLVASGNAGNRSFRAPLAEALAEEGFSVLLFDYRGYGDNPGHPSEDGLALDVRAAYRYLSESESVPDDRLIYFGESLGAAVVTELATEHPPAGLVLRSPFTDLAAVGRVHYPYLPVGALLRDRFPLIEHIRTVDVPTVIVYGTEDTIVPPQQSISVADAAPGTTTVVEVRADHNDQALLNGRELINAVVDLSNGLARN